MTYPDIILFRLRDQKYFSSLILNYSCSRAILYDLACAETKFKKTLLFSYHPWSSIVAHYWWLMHKKIRLQKFKTFGRWSFSGNFTVETDDKARISLWKDKWVYFLSWLDQRGVWSYQSTLVSRKSFFSQWYLPLSGRSTNENLWEIIASSPFIPCPLAPTYLTHVDPFCSPKWRAWRTKITLPLPLNGIWVKKCTHVQGCQLSQIIKRILHCLSYLTVNIKDFLMNSGIPFSSVCFIANSCWLEAMSIFCTNDVMCRTIPGYPNDKFDNRYQSISIN